MTQQFDTITIRPNQLQFLIDNWIGLVVFVAIAIYAGADDDRMSPFAIMGVVLLGIYLILEFVALKRKVFVISSETLLYDRGIFSRNADYIELYRVVDFQEKHSFLQQIVGLKTVVVYSGDRTTPKLYIPGLDYRSCIIEEIRRRVEFNKARRSIYEITNRY